MSARLGSLPGSLRGRLDAAVTLRAPTAKSYFRIGMWTLALLAACILLGFSLRHVFPKSASFAWSVASGLILLGCILYQWMLFFARLQGRAAEARRHWSLHRYVGTAAILLFVLHAGALGYAMLSVLAVGFLIVAVTGLWNTEVAILRKAWLRRAWEIGHIGVSGLLMPLIALHVWAALAFK